MASAWRNPSFTSQRSAAPRVGRLRRSRSASTRAKVGGSSLKATDWSGSGGGSARASREGGSRRSGKGTTAVIS